MRRDFRAMNSDIELMCCAADADRRLDRAETWVTAFEQRYSRFRVLSELSRLNASAGRPFKASLGLYRLVSLGLDLAQRSGGLFDPTVLSQLVSAGYDRSFELLQTQDVSRSRQAVPRASWRDVVLDPKARNILLPAGCGIDLGGIGKGFAVDRVSTILGTPSMANGGGDIYAAGRPPDDSAWRVGVADPFQPARDLIVVRVIDRGVATSSSLKRSWRSGGLALHHLIDPRTGRPSDSDAVQVTVVAPSALLADYHAKVALLRGFEAGLVYLTRQPETEGLLVRADGAVEQTPGLSIYF
ncbi:MAG TPA: FAD:protein FMN transferase [Dehalococcoidia bacterium]|nr:FAD:protein FMN transferase [Dehalococcoidia bacterium]